MTIRAALTRFLSDQSGATAIEYALIAAMVAVVVISVAGTGGAVDALYETFGLATDALAGANAE